jgi:parallel beta-helix repeat protein
MEMKKIYHKYIVILVLFILSLSLGFISNSNIKTRFSIQIILTESNHSSFTIHDPINIVSDQNFTDYGFPGSGTEEDPYRIENFLINTTEDKAVSIEKTNKSFTIDNCVLSADRYGIYVKDAGTERISVTKSECSNSWIGIYLFNCSEVFISENSCFNNSDYGIFIDEIKDEVNVLRNNCSRNEDGLCVQDSLGVTVAENICNENDLRGLIVWESESLVYQNVCDNNGYSGINSQISYPSLFYNNTCSSNFEYGIRLSGSSSSIVFNNTCSNNRKGIYVKECFHVKVYNNTCVENEDGIYFTDGSWYSTISENYIFNNSQDGISLTPSKSTSILNNTILGNRRYGIFAERSLVLTVSYNLIKNNEGYGVFLVGTTNSSVVTYNSFVNNNPSGSSQGFDNGNKNQWYDEESKTGNHWSDHKGRGKYSIDGSAESIDKYPLNEQLERVTYSHFLLISLSFILISIPVIRKRNSK